MYFLPVNSDATLQAVLRPSDQLYLQIFKMVSNQNDHKSIAFVMHTLYTVNLSENYC